MMTEHLIFANGKFTFNGSTLTIAGGVNIGSTAASTIESNANSALQIRR
jgi:hypothetical protein